MLYVLWSTATDTYGLNVHYIPQIFSSRGWKYKRLTLHQTAEMMIKMRNHPALKVFFDFIEKPAFSSMNYRTKIKVLKARWPRLMNVMFRHYKTPYIQVIETAPRLLADSFFQLHAELEQGELSTTDKKIGD